MTVSMNAKSLRALSAAISVAVSGLTVPLAAQAEATGNIGVFSKYVLRGIANNAENDGTTIQGGFDYAAGNGFFVGYWGSNLDYTYDAGLTESTATAGTSSNSATGFEHDFYAGYGFKAGSVDFTVGATQYYYVEVDDSNLLEPFVTATIGPVTLGMKYLAQDGFWGNKGDMYWTIAAGTDLPKGFTLSGTLGYYNYEKSDSAELCLGATGVKTAGCGTTTASSEFRHLDLSLSHPIGKTGADMMITYIIGGKDRTKTDQDNAFVFAVKYPFDL